MNSTPLLWSFWSHLKVEEVLRHKFATEIIFLNLFTHMTLLMFVVQAISRTKAWLHIWFVNTKFFMCFSPSFILKWQKMLWEMKTFQNSFKKCLYWNNRVFKMLLFFLWKIKQVFENVDGKSSSLTVFSSVFSCILAWTINANELTLLSK